jgi:hypothetical protein
MTALRVSQAVIEALTIASVDARISQIALEPLAVRSPNTRVTQAVLESLTVGGPHVRVSQATVEALRLGMSRVRVSQIVIEILCKKFRIPMLPLYPTLDGLTYDVTWEPQFFNMKTDTTETGADIDLSLSSWPLHDFELTYSVLRNGFWNDPQRYGGTEFATLMGFFLQTQGTFGRFLFLNPDDNKITGQAVGTTDGVTSVYGPLMRTFGVADYNGTEPVGVVNTGATLVVYLDDVPQDSATYTILTDVPCLQQIKFNSTPAAGKAITIDMSYWYYCKLPSNANTFRKFMSTLWDLNKITLHSCRAGA